MPETNITTDFTFQDTSLTVNRVGYGAMQLAGRDGAKMAWGPPRFSRCHCSLRKAVPLGI